MAIRKSKKFTRDPKAPKVLEKDIQPWDLEVFRLLQEHRLLTTSHFVNLTSRSTRTVQDRLKRLWNGHFIDRLDGDLAGTGNLNNPSIYALTKNGANILINLGEYARPKLEAVRKSGQVHVEHTLLIADFLLRVKASCDASNGRVRYMPKDEILSGNKRLLRNLDKQLSISAPVYTSYGKEERSTVPDGLFGLEFSKERNRRFFFLEADRGTMPKTRSVASKERNKGREQTDLYRKYSVYDSYRDLDVSREEFGFGAFFVLLLTDKNEQRVTNAVKDMRPVYVRKDGSMPGYRRWLFGCTESILNSNQDILTVPWVMGDGEPGTLYV